MADAARPSRGLPEADRARLWAWASMGRLSVGDLDGAARLADLVGTVAAEGGDELARCIAMSTLATVRHFRGRFGEAVELAEAAVRLADRSQGRGAHRFHLHFYLGIFLLDVDRLEEAQPGALQRGRVLSEELGAKWSLPIYQWASALARFVSGDWDDASAECEACLELAEDVGTRRGVLFSHSLASIIALHRGALAPPRTRPAAERELAAKAPAARPDLEYWVLLARALVLEATGRRGRPARGCGAPGGRAPTPGTCRTTPTSGPDLVRLSLAAGQPRGAAEVTVGVQSLAAANPGVARLRALPCSAGAGYRRPRGPAAGGGRAPAGTRPLELAAPARTPPRRCSGRRGRPGRPVV